MFELEVLRARHGDALLLHYGTSAKPKLAVIDGGPSPVYADALKPRLERLRTDRGLDASTPLDVDLMMVSHIDDDHIGGILRLVRALKDAADSGDPRPYRIRSCWHNAFDDILGGRTAAVTGASMAASLGGAASGTLVLASVPQGRELRDLLQALSVKVNPEARGALIKGGLQVEHGNLAFTVIAPSEANLQALQADWDRKVAELLKKKGAREASLELADYADKSVYNLASIVVLVEADGRRLLLTGDGRGDHTLEGLHEAGLVGNGALVVDVLKLPHHGSDRTVEKDYFETIRADHYVISADGKHHNPDVKTLEMLSAARRDDDFTIHLTYPPDDFNDPDVGREVAKFFAAEKRQGREYRVRHRHPNELSFTIALDS